MGSRRWLRCGLALAATMLSLACRAPEALAPPHGIVLIGLDTLRADGLSCYGNPRPTSPAIDRLASEGVLFENAISHAAWTLPGFAGLFTASYFSTRVFRGKLVFSLVERFRQAGYATAAFTEGGYVATAFGFDRGFDEFHEAFRGSAVIVPEKGGGAVRTFAQARAWLEQHADRPFFLFVHSYEPHVPYLDERFSAGMPSGAIEGRYELTENTQVLRGEIPVGEVERAYVRALYDGDVAAVDHEVGRLLETLNALGVADRTIVAVTSDHGEALGERRPSELGLHGHALYDTLVRVPLILRDPRQTFPVKRVTAQVRLIDVMPTLLDLAGLETVQGVPGRSLVPMLRGDEEADRIAYSELLFREDRRLRRAAVRDGRYKLILNAPGSDTDQVLELYDLETDPEERVNRVDELGEVRNRLQFALDDQRTAIAREGRPNARAAEAEVDEGVRERLRALGYVE